MSDSESNGEVGDNNSVDSLSVTGFKGWGSTVSLDNSLRLVENKDEVEIGPKEQHTPPTRQNMESIHTQNNVITSPTQNSLDTTITQHEGKTEGNTEIGLSAIMKLLVEMDKKNEKRFADMKRDREQDKAELNNKLDELRQDLHDEMKEIRVEMKRFESRADVIETRLDQTEGRLVKIENEVEVNDERCTKLINDKTSYLNSEINKVGLKLFEVESRVQQVETYNRETEDRNVDRLDRCEKSVKSCFSKIKELEEKHETESIVLVNRLESVEKSRPIEDSDFLEKISKKIESRFKTSMAVCVEGKSLSTISANAELFLSKFDNNAHGLQPMMFLKYARKFVEVSGDNWEVQLLQITKYLEGEPKIWARQHLDKFDNFGKFEDEFKKRYWGVIRQRQFEHELMGSGNFNSSRLDLVTYVMNQYSVNKMLDKPLSIELFLNYICRHVPESMGAAIQSAISVKEIKNEAEMESLCKNIGVVRDRESLPSNRFVKYDREQYRPENGVKKDDFKTDKGNFREIKTNVVEISSEKGKGENDRDIERDQSKGNDESSDRNDRYENRSWFRNHDNRNRGGYRGRGGHINRGGQNRFGSN